MSKPFIVLLSALSLANLSLASEGGPLLLKREAGRTTTAKHQTCEVHEKLVINSWWDKDQLLRVEATPLNVSAEELRALVEKKILREGRGSVFFGRAQTYFETLTYYEMGGGPIVLHEESTFALGGYEGDGLEELYRRLSTLCAPNEAAMEN